MIKLFILFLLPLSLLNASKILSYNIYDRTDRADVMITFDTPYEGVIRQSVTRSKIIIKLQDASIESPKIKKVSSKFLHSITITPMKNQTQIVASVPSSVKLIASKTADAYGLRLRFASKTAKKQTSKQTAATNIIHKANTQANPLSNLPTKKDDGMSTSYYIVVTILVIGVFILFFIKKRMVQKGITPPQNSPWLFQEASKTKTTDQVAKGEVPPSTSQISIRFQKPINENNSVVMLDFGEQSYLVLIGKSNILLDKFTDNKPTTQEDFESILKSRHQELDEFLQVEENAGRSSQSQSSFASSNEALQAYKEKAGAISYES